MEEVQLKLLSVLRIIFVICPKKKLFLPFSYVIHSLFHLKYFCNPCVPGTALETGCFKIISSQKIRVSWPFALSPEVMVPENVMKRENHKVWVQLSVGVRKQADELNSGSLFLLFSKAVILHVSVTVPTRETLGSHQIITSVPLVDCD